MNRKFTVYVMRLTQTIIFPITGLSSVCRGRKILRLVVDIRYNHIEFHLDADGL